jgi:uncharacterized paraquat-inducible protein A
VALSRRHSATGPLRLTPVEHVVRWQEESDDARSTHLATATLACPDCDAPVAAPAGAVAPAHPLACPYCPTTGAVRDFLSFDRPARPARVAVRVILRRDAVRRPARAETCWR